MTVRVYRWDDASAPTLDGSAAGHRLIDVLDKCLVAGYGSKSAAGWSKLYTGTGKAVFRNGTGSTQLYLRIDSSSSGQNPRIRGYETMSDVDTGTGPFPTDVQLSGGAHVYVSSTTDTTARPWVVVADEKRFYLYIGHDNTTATGLASTTLKQTYFAGDIASYKTSDAYHYLLVAGSASGTNSTQLCSCTQYTSATAGHWLARDYIASGGAITVSKSYSGARFSTAPVIGTVGSNYPNPVTGSLDIDPVYVNEVTLNVPRGKMPGLWAPLHNLPASPGDTFSGSGSLSGKTFLLLDSAGGSTRGRIAIETSDTW